MNFRQFYDVPFVSHVCEYNITWWHYYRFRIETDRQFPFHCGRIAKTDTRSALCGSRQCLASFVNGLRGVRIIVILTPHYVAESLQTGCHNDRIYAVVLQTQ